MGRNACIGRRHVTPLLREITLVALRENARRRPSTLPQGGRERERRCYMRSVGPEGRESLLDPQRGFTREQNSYPDMIPSSCK